MVPQLEFSADHTVTKNTEAASNVTFVRSQSLQDGLMEKAASSPGTKSKKYFPGAAHVVAAVLTIEMKDDDSPRNFNSTIEETKLTSVDHDAWNGNQSTSRGHVGGGATVKDCPCAQDGSKTPLCLTPTSTIREDGKAHGSSPFIGADIIQGDNDCPRMKLSEIVKVRCVEPGQSVTTSSSSSPRSEDGDEAESCCEEEPPSRNGTHLPEDDTHINLTSSNTGSRERVSPPANGCSLPTDNEHIQLTGSKTERRNGSTSLKDHAQTNSKKSSDIEYCEVKSPSNLPAQGDIMSTRGKADGELAAALDAIEGSLSETLASFDPISFPLWMKLRIADDSSPCVPPQVSMSVLRNPPNFGHGTAWDRASVREPRSTEVNDGCSTNDRKPPAEDRNPASKRIEPLDDARAQASLLDMDPIVVPICSFLLEHLR